MRYVKEIIRAIQGFNIGFTFIAPYQENAADFRNGYATVTIINSVPQTTVGEVATPDKLHLWQVNGLLTRFHFYKYVDYNAEITAEIAARRLRLYLSSFDAMQQLNVAGLNAAPQLSELHIDTYRDAERNLWVEHAHFECRFFVKDELALDSGVFEHIIIENKEIIEREE